LAHALVGPDVGVTGETWLAFLVVETALCLTPGPAVLLVLSQGMTRGARASLWSTLGILAGNSLYFAASATGLGAVIVASYDAFSAIRWLGAGYLVCLGIATFAGRSPVLSVDVHGGSARPGRMFVNGFVLQTANPKALLFFTALLPQFIDPRAGVTTQVMALGVTSVVVEFVVLAGYGMLAGRATGLARRPRFASLANRVAGSLLITAGVGAARFRRA
jgi:homoserine/homoserine lactone efflux protein